MDSMRFAWGSVIGSSHYKSRKNNQDALAIYRNQNLFIGFVADGCGDVIDSPHSEVGARIGAKMAVNLTSNLVKRMTEQEQRRLTHPLFWDRVRNDMLSRIRYLATSMGESFSEVITKHFLFTLIGVVITPNLGVFVSLGDGVIIVNGEVLRIGPFANNSPMYLGYNLVRTSLVWDDPHALKFNVQRVVPTSEMSSFLIGCDGVDDLMSARDKKIPGREDLVGPISQFWSEEIYFANPHAATNKLRLIAEEKRLIDWENQSMRTFPGHLPDDTTFISGAKL